MKQPRSFDDTISIRSLTPSVWFWSVQTGRHNKRIELTRPNRDGAYQPHRD